MLRTSNSFKIMVSLSTSLREIIDILQPLNRTQSRLVSLNLSGFWILDNLFLSQELLKTLIAKSKYTLTEASEIFQAQVSEKRSRIKIILQSVVDSNGSNRRTNRK